ncbi:MAG TPA: hypothetical protein DCG57_07420 [Candidatus Riflebacteria bacterium]|nr:hypothetical protein [Candidatus Riflebacteria bacterium]
MALIFRSSSIIYKALVVGAFCAALLLPQQAEARVLAGSVTERKINRKIESMLKAARKNYDNGKVQVALENYWKILEIDPQETFAYLELGEIYVGLRIYDRAIELLEPGLTMAQREMDRDTICYYYCVLTQAHLALNQTGLANKTLIKAAEAAPKNPMPREILGDIYLANNRIADAIKAYKKAIELDPDYQSAKEKLGTVMAKHGDQTQTRAKDHNAIARKAEPLPPQKTVAKAPAKPVAPATAGTPQKVATAAAAQTPARPQPATAVNIDDTEPEGSENETGEIEEDSEEDSDNDVVEVSSSDKTGEEGTASAAIPDDMSPLPLPVPAKPATTTPRPLPGNQTATQTATIPAAVTPATVMAATASPTADAKPETAKTAAPSASAQEIEDQIDKLLAGTPEDKSAAVIFFLKLEEKGLTEIEELLYDPDPEVRIIAIRTVTEFKAFKQRVKSMLEDANEDPDPVVGEEIEKALAKL